MWRQRLIGFGVIALALVVAIWAELNEHPSISGSHQQQQYAAEKVS
jgi:hypothetical protein